MKTAFLFLMAISFYQLACAQDQRTSFEALTVVTTPTGLAAQLTWKRGDEDVAFYVVERSNDGIDFKQCAIVFLSDDPEFTSYKFRDKISGYSNGLLYRIGIVNDQKRISYLPVKRVMSPTNP